MYHLLGPRDEDGKSCSMVWKREVVSEGVGVVRAIAFFFNCYVLFFSFLEFGWEGVGSCCCYTLGR